MIKKFKAADDHTVIPLRDWACNVHSLTVQRRQNVHYGPVLKGNYISGLFLKRK